MSRGLNVLAFDARHHYVISSKRGFDHVDRTNRILDEFAKLMTDAAGAAQGVRREVETAFKGQPSASSTRWMWCSARSSRLRARDGRQGEGREYPSCRPHRGARGKLAELTGQAAPAAAQSPAQKNNR